MGKSAKLQNLSYVGGAAIKQVSIIDHGYGGIELSPILYGVFSGKNGDIGTWQSLRQGNVIISKRIGDKTYKVFRVTDNSGNFIQVNNPTIVSSFLTNAEKSVIKFLENNDPFLNKSESEWIVNINKQKRIDEFSKRFGINLSKKALMFRKEDLCLVPEPEPKKFSINHGSTLYESDGKGRCVVVKGIMDIPAGMYMIVKTDRSVHVYIRMSNERVSTI